MIIRRSALVLALLTLSTCDAEEADDDDAACEASDGTASVTVDNRTGGTIETVTATPCDGGEAQELAVSADGIEFSTQATLALPGPGCWELQWSGGGCSNESPHRTANDVCAGGTYEWTVGVGDRVCDGGW